MTTRRILTTVLAILTALTLLAPASAQRTRPTPTPTPAADEHESIVYVHRYRDDVINVRSRTFDTLREAKLFYSLLDTESLEEAVDMYVIDEMEQGDMKTYLLTDFDLVGAVAIFRDGYTVTMVAYVTAEDEPDFELFFRFVTDVVYYGLDAPAPRGYTITEDTRRGPSYSW
ncbi:hypothetical protein [Microbacterium sp.]|uniref:hypothetical protein n=1 Tax=Microbacterium sp. TaxID=51671 RepID=UPI0026150AC3|nr:hypothetical protein [Microbacterium sp.]